MTRLILLLFLLSGCAASRPSATDVERPHTLAEVNAVLDGERVRIDLGDRYFIAPATRVRVSMTEVVYHFDQDPPDSLRVLPIASMAQISRLEQGGETRDGAGGALLGAIPGAILLGLALSADTESDTGNVGEEIAGTFAKVLAVVGGTVLMAAGANLGGARARAAASRRRAVVYRGPVERYADNDSEPGRR